MGYLNKFVNARLLLIICFTGAFLPALFWGIKVTAQQQTSSNTNTNPSPSATPTPSLSPTPIPLSFIITEREKTEKRLEEIEKKISENTAVSQVQTDLFEVTKDLDSREQEANNLLALPPSLEALDKTEREWTSTSLSIPSWKSRLEEQSAEISDQIRELQNTLAVWELTGQAIEAEPSERGKENIPEKLLSNNNTANIGASKNRNTKVNLNINGSGANVNLAGATPVIELPGNVREQVDKIIEKIKQAQINIQANLSELLKLQEKISETEKRTTNMLGRIVSVRKRLLSNLIVKDSPAIWNIGSFQPNLQEVRNSFAGKFDALREYFVEHQGLFLFHLVIILILILAFYWARLKTRRMVEQEPDLKPGFVVFEFPLASALILGLFFGPLLYLHAPTLLGVIVSPLLVIAIFFVFRRLIEKPYIPILVGLTALYLINDLRLFMASSPFLSRVLFLAEMLGGIVFLLWLISSGNRIKESADPDSYRHGIVKNTSIFVLLPFTFAFLANALGYVSLASVVGKAIVSGLSLGLILYALVIVFDSLLIFLFRIPPFSKLRMVKSHRALIQEKIFKIVKWLSVVVWILVLLSVLYLLKPFLDLAQRLLTTEIGVGSISVSLSGILAFILTIWFSFLLSRVVSFALAEDIYPRVNLPDGLPYATTTILHYLVLLIGFFLALAAAGIDLTKFAIFFGALGVGIGIGLQNIVENFTSGIILLLERPVKVGDLIQMKEHYGQLRSIGLRASVVRTFDGAEIIVPNGQLITHEVTNWTLSDPRRRIDINVGVEYGANPEIVIKLLEEVAKNHPDSDNDLSPHALFWEFGDNSLNFQLRVWTSKFDKWIFLKSDLTTGIYKALIEAGINIPFPQRDLHIKSVDDGLLTNVNPVLKEGSKSNNIKQKAARKID